MAQLPLFLPYLLDVQQFAAGKYDARRSFLFGLTGTKMDRHSVAKRMSLKGVTDRCIERIKPNLQSGFKSAHAEAFKEAGLARAEWKGVSGETYGSQKAVGWKPVPPEGFDPQILATQEASLGVNNAELNKYNVEKGRLTAKIEAAEKLLESQGDRAEFDPALLSDKLNLLETEESDLANGLAVARGMNSQLANAREKVPVPCCECGALLKVQFSGKACTVEPYEPMSDEDQQKLQAAIINKAEDNSDTQKRIDVLRKEVVDLQRLEALSIGGSDKVTRADIEFIQLSIDDCDLQIQNLSETIAAQNDAVSKLREMANKIRDLKVLEERAATLHQSVQDWEACYATLAPDGIPAEILADALNPVNSRLRSTSIDTGWPQVSIDPQMEIVVDGRPYNLLSESAKWRADAAIADAIAFLSGLGILILDRIDVLDLPNRKALMTWMQGIMTEYDSILLFGTLKSAPSMPTGMDSHWIEAGEVS